MNISEHSVCHKRKMLNENCSQDFYQLVGQLFLLGIIGYFVYKLFRGLWTCWIASAFGFGVTWRDGRDSWAIITGCTDGLGLEFAKEMAAKGYSLLLISRNEEKLQRTKSLIMSQFPKVGEVKIFAADLSKLEVFPSIRNVVNQLEDIDVLVNNCGASYCYPEYFADIPFGEKVVENIINVNIIATTQMIQIVLPKMASQRRGIIINLSSIAATIPTPLLAVYSAAKAYVDFLSQALNLEYKSHGIIVQSLLPGYVKTKMAAIRNTSWMVPSPSVFVRASLDTVGIEDRTNGYWAHKLLVFARELMGKQFNLFLTWYWVRDVRKRYYNKMAKEQMRARYSVGSLGTINELALNNANANEMNNNSSANTAIANSAFQ